MHKRFSHSFINVGDDSFTDVPDRSRIREAELIREWILIREIKKGEGEEEWWSDNGMPREIDIEFFHRYFVREMEGRL